MAVMDSIGALIGALALFFGALGSTAAYLINRMKKLERENDAKREKDLKDLEHERDQLRKRVTELEEKAGRVATLETRLDTQSEILKDVQSRLEKAEASLVTALHENEQLRKDNADKDKQITDLQSEIAMLKNTISSYEKVFMFIGAEREKQQASSGATAPVELAAQEPPAVAA